MGDGGGAALPSRQHGQAAPVARSALPPPSTSRPHSPKSCSIAIPNADRWALWAPSGQRQAKIFGQAASEQKNASRTPVPDSGTHHSTAGRRGWAGRRTPSAGGAALWAPHPAAGGRRHDHPRRPSTKRCASRQPSSAQAVNPAAHTHPPRRSTKPPKPSTNLPRSTLLTFSSHHRRQLTLPSRQHHPGRRLFLAEQRPIPQQVEHQHHWHSDHRCRQHEPQ